MRTLLPDDPTHLQNALADALRALPGAFELRAFGSLTRGNGSYDAYSDIDLELLTTDVDATVAARHAVLAQVGPIWLEWRIHPSHSGWAATILFTEFSPYRHLDLGITPADLPDSVDSLDARTILWHQPARTNAPLLPRTAPYAPEIGTPEHMMLEQLLSAVRYLKARKRGQILTAYRFAAALATASFAMLEAVRTGDIGQLWRKPSTMSFLAIDGQLPAAERRDVLSLLDFSTPERMDASVHGILRHNLEQYPSLPGAGDFPPDIAARLMTFVDAERAG